MTGVRVGHGAPVPRDHADGPTGAAVRPTLRSHTRPRTQVQVRQPSMLLTLTGLFGGGSGARYSGATGPMTRSGELVGRVEWALAGRAALAYGVVDRARDPRCSSTRSPLEDRYPSAQTVIELMPKRTTHEVPRCREQLPVYVAGASWFTPRYIYTANPGASVRLISRSTLV